ncbi:hypothetical protein [Methanoculleus bourgensis]|uniref:hypothetical protein n=1 Tax=Methanoculleus bourgensis TaxID=83986 RepID=UPI0022EEB456|nr:hypothetical protein [Methanoculleus bourgensis]GLI45879.1 hypothetical protein MBOURGENBZM_06710 [Methanoculleus bourgensis]
MTVLVYSHPAGNCLVRGGGARSGPGVEVFIPTLEEAPVVYAPIGLVVAGLLAFALRRWE